MRVDSSLLVPRRSHAMTFSDAKGSRSPPTSLLDFASGGQADKRLTHEQLYETKAKYFFFHQHPVPVSKSRKKPEAITAM